VATRKRKKKKPQKSNTWWMWSTPILAVILCLSIVIYRYYAVKKEHFGIAMPKGFHTHGIDISQYQGAIDWDRLCSPQDSDIHISFVYMRATMGMRADKQFATNWKEAKEHGLKRGAYLYFHPNKDGVKQAEWFIKKVGSLNGSLPPVVDIEKTHKTDKTLLKKRLQSCLNALHNYYGTRPVIYTYTTFYRDYLGESFDAYPLWIAHYEREDKPDYIKREWDIWQHSERGRIAGVSEYVDFNVLNCKNNIMPCEVCGE